ncbi:MAG: insulinase family protein, partial [Lachnospiraceae bacterium]|nr:insulinase family protein [Lachnospiraceae bacterium]
MGTDEIRALVSDTEALHKYQAEADSEEVLKTIPLLSISDIRKEAEGFVNEVSSTGSVPTLYHDIFTNGIAYITVAFDISRMPEELIPYVGILKAVLGMVNTKNYTYADLANEIFLNSGGISANTSMYLNVDDGNDFTHYFEMKARVLYDRIPFAFEMIREIVFTSDLTDKKRLREIIGMLRSRLQGVMMSSGHVVALHRALSGISKSEMITDRMSGIAFYRVVEAIEDDFDNSCDGLIDKLQKVSSMIFTADNLKLFDLTAEKSECGQFVDMAKEFATACPSSTQVIKDAGLIPSRLNEAYRTSAKVQYVAKAGTYMSDETKYTGALKVLKVIMGYEYLWKEVRVVGGAYGCFAAFSRGGRGSFASYRDPNLSRTLEVYDKASDFLKSFDAPERDMTKYIIGTVSDLDFPLSPSAKGARSREAYITGDTVEKIQKERDEILGCTADDIRDLYRYIDNMKKDECICVLGGEEEIKKEEALFDRTEPLFLK